MSLIRMDTYKSQIPMAASVVPEWIRFAADPQCPGDALHQFESAIDKIVSRAVREAVAEDRKARAAANPASRDGLETCPECGGVDWRRVSTLYGCRAHRCPRCAVAGVVAAREAEGEGKAEHAGGAQDAPNLCPVCKGSRLDVASDGTIVDCPRCVAPAPPGFPETLRRALAEQTADPFVVREIAATLVRRMALGDVESIRFVEERGGRHSYVV